MQEVVGYSIFWLNYERVKIEPERRDDLKLCQSAGIFDLLPYHPQKVLNCVFKPFRIWRYAFKRPISASITHNLCTTYDILSVSAYIRVSRVEEIYRRFKCIIAENECAEMQGTIWLGKQINSE